MRFWEAKKEKLHTRSIEISTYEYDGQKLIVEGFLKDDRFQESRIITGESFPEGVIHHMAVRLLINCSDMVIEEIEAELLSVPREICRETLNCLAPVRGLSITKGFTAKVKKLVGGNRGCTHLVELLLAMAPAAIQGYASYQSKRPQSPNPERSKMILQFLVNTCRAWREDGPLVEILKKKFNLR
ncbi:MAG TPA: DUF2889 domain-containing protein [Smithellaceae bacterium]|nr:DUF2889 domain-containing protein [Smithellaceae bacterium]HRS88527.1 DUF2889 domain-containing protein [Smithellaceae bacterium]HRV25281.1 DUF2889 domain-containing protein [Smithellaceae bacterium]